MHIYVDADACPVKDETIRVAERIGARVTLVAAQGMRPRREAHVDQVAAGPAFDAADDWIAERIQPGDLCVTNDIPLAARCVEKGAKAISPTGRIFDERTIGEAVAMRNLNQHVREAMQGQTFNKPFGPKQRSRFLQAMDQAITVMLNR